MTLRLATWNINSVRLRLDLLLRLIDKTLPDVICLQETKVTDDAFPRTALADRGFIHIHAHGMKGYNGVAILSRIPFAAPAVQRWCGRDDCRHAAVMLAGGIELHCLYVPAGGDTPDPVANPKFAHKLQFLDEITSWWTTLGHGGRPIILAGDLNIAPLENDVWSHRELLDVVSHTPVEVEKLGRLQASLDWCDVARHFIPPEQKLYTWWSYRARDWHATNRGRRLDHIWVTRPLVPTLGNFQVLSSARAWEPKPSDHVPVLVDLAVDPGTAR